MCVCVCVYVCVVCACVCCMAHCVLAVYKFLLGQAMERRNLTSPRGSGNRPNGDRPTPQPQPQPDQPTQATNSSYTNWSGHLGPRLRLPYPSPYSPLVLSQCFPHSIFSLIALLISSPVSSFMYLANSRSFCCSW